MVDKIREFSCQYSNQIRKKHKSWHDGKLRYYSSSNRFVLYDENNKQIGSAFITNNRKLVGYLDPENFEKEEHHIFGSFLVVLLGELVCEQKPLPLPKLNGTTRDDSADPVIVKRENENEFVSKGVKKPGRVLKSNISPKNSSSLAISLLQPFKPPRVVDQEKLMNSQSSVVVKKETIADIEQKCSRRNFAPSKFASPSNHESGEDELANVRAASPIPSSLDPVVYMKESNGILKTGRLRKKTYTIRNVPITL